MAKTIILGSEYEEGVHGIRGIATSTTEFLTGCNRTHLEKLKDDGTIKGYTVDDLLLTKVRNGKKSPLKPPPKSKLKLGETYQDVTHGVVGVAIAKSIYLNSRDAQIALEFLVGDDLKVHWFDESSLKKVDPIKQVIPAPTAEQKKTGGPQIEAPTTY